MYDYLSYEYAHNATLKSLIDKNFNGTTSLNILHNLADMQQWALNGDLTKSGWRTGDQIRAIAGKSAASMIYQLLASNIQSQGRSRKLNLLFTDYQPFMALASLMSLNSNNNANFKNIPAFGASMVFELFSWDSGISPAKYPSKNDLYVRFYYRNNSDDGTALERYSMFSAGPNPNQADMKWSDFENNMAKIMVGNVADWCNTCGSFSVFCAAYNSSFTYVDDSNGHDGSGSGRSGSDAGLSKQAAGVVGAAVTLGVVLILAAIAVFAFGVRFHRVDRSHKSDLGGFKGSAKLASDQDLVLPKGAAGAAVVTTAAAHEESHEPKGHERVGSWELKKPGNVARRPSYEDDGIGPMTRPVKTNDMV